MKTRVVNLRGRRPRRYGTWGYRAMQLVTMPLAPIATSFVRRSVIRAKRIGLRVIQPSGMTPAQGAATLGTSTHPGLRRRQRIGMRLIKPGNVPV